MNGVDSTVAEEDSAENGLDSVVVEGYNAEHEKIGPASGVDIASDDNSVPYATIKFI